MRAITLTQPWASLVAMGAKQYETRSFRAHYRGPLLIHAAKGFSDNDRRIASEHPCFKAVLDFNQHRVFALAGHILALVDLVDCIETERFVAPGSYVGPDRVLLSSQEFAFGNYHSGRWAWKLTNVRALPRPIKQLGTLGLWRPPDVVVDEVTRQLTAQEIRS